MYKVTNTDTLPKLPHTSQQKLRTGQIIQGRILKLYPENKAEIQLGARRFVASLEVGLQAGAKYHFQVQSATDLIQLKVLGEELKGKGEIDISGLLKQLGLKQSKININLLNSLVQSKIPFDQQQISQAVNLLKDAPNKTEANQILAEMISKKLPIRESVFHALSENAKSTLGEQLKSVIQHLNTTTKQVTIPNRIETTLVNNSSLSGAARLTEANLTKAITELTEKPILFKTALVKEVLSQNQLNNSSLFRSLQGLGLVNLDVNYSQWVTEWTAFSQKENITAASIQSNQTLTSALPFQLSEQTLSQSLVNIAEQKPSFGVAIKNFLNQWDKQLNFHGLIKGSMTKEDFATMQSNFKKDIFPFYNENQRAVFNQLSNSSNGLSSFYNAIQALVNGQDLSTLMQTLQKATGDEQFLAMEPKNQFLNQLALTLNSLGLDYENRLMNESNLAKQTETIKGMLLQLVGNPEAMQTEASTKLLNLINGIQLQSVNETQAMLQANIHIPAERLGLVKDLELEFEGQKTENGEINPDFCRILFYLDLGNLKETIIDMNIQQRKIVVTIFNNHEAINDVGNLYKNKLEDSLEAIDYKLTTLQYKKLEEKDKIKPVGEKNFLDPNQQGVDYRI